MLRNTRTAALAFLAVGALSLTACGGGSNDDAGSSDAGNEFNLVSDGALTVCSDIPYAPFEYEENGEYTGFDMDLIREIATGMGLELEVQDVGFDGLQSGTVLAAGQCDLGASAMTITPEREEKLGFSEPYYDSLQSLLVPADSDTKALEDMSGKKLGVQQGTTGEAYARDNIPDDVEIVSFPSDAELFPALQSGNVDAVLQDLPVNLGHTDDGAFTIAEKFQTDESYGFAMEKENTELISAVNEQLSELRENGKYQEIYDKYFTE
ncbi:MULTISPECIES: basic amino acid ABC transporter substrate-binding protein [unclassified Arthrobacter]|uniref:basic amino acid ABC transporter substrate-binding protein n=1 Tax=unclassified Arthrobacter TaxID=235627 RepID=UPI001D159483|nr:MULTISPECIES: basic amino acid ABC transporter substrate-binding protein [unclassified Arthrobacter]MCC3275963.1 basic amino acid ABC transporter substrate-binding protein [Arthrobacter sp. zg-Y20]MCC3278057.1 basic amino acid ABC transporter substrate-binding protein [Arthrobacter sp. zg-Y40]MCC9176452.1 basic amino acid ABC transporter substrate-binding protein [Arthrobacter sp. zg-Y750]MDK1316120.1 basic amino acid ABC transporter substrate-binding protein [Arthrobacter sp. zg.Y20]MDK132